MKRESKDKKTSVKGARIYKQDHGRLLYAAGILGLAALVVCAFYLPSIVFDFQDRRLSQETMLERQETVDATMLVSSAYEFSLYNRMTQFAEGLDNGNTYYVSELDLEVTEEKEEQLKSIVDDLIESEFIMAMDQVGLITTVLYRDFVVAKWKQYVIYSDDYAQGVNFNIWYLELADRDVYENVMAAEIGIDTSSDADSPDNPDNRRLAFLVDAETYTIYGVRTFPAIKMSEEARFQNAFTGSLWNYCLRAYVNPELWWYIFCYYYQALSEEQIAEYIETVYASESYSYMETEKDIIAYRNGRDILPDNMGWAYLDENHFTLMIPYEASHLDFSARLIPDESGSLYWFPEVMFGIEPICRLIPEFQIEN